MELEDPLHDLFTRALKPVALACVVLLGCTPRNTTLDYVPGSAMDETPRMGGKAVLVREEDPDYLDPALSYGLLSGPVTLAIYHTLLDYVDLPGAAGADLEPDLAVSLPELREGGTLYCFKVRPDARFGPPANRHITASDFKYALERLFALNSPAIPFYQVIAGANDVLAGHTTTLSGVIARGDSLYIRLVAPDAVFLHILTMTFSAPVPAEVAEVHTDDFSQHTVATGPYRVAEFAPRRRVLLVRNEAYCGPPAYLDTIEVRLGVSTTNAVALIKRGTVDGGFFDVPTAELGRLRSDPIWGQQLNISDGLNTTYLFMNVRVPPFNDVRVRQAVCWALDRRAFVKVYGGAVVEAHEFLPLEMPGAKALHRYEGPDLERARQLLAEAGHPNGFKTKLYGWTTGAGPRELTIIQQQLSEVGIEVELDLGEASGYTAMAGDTANRIPFGIYGWNADYVDPSNFLDVIMNGDRITPTQNQNLSMFDDFDVNAVIRRALGETDPEVRTRLWQTVDEMVMDRAPIATMYHQYEPRIYSLRLGGWYRHVTRIIKLESLFLKEPVTATGPSQ